MADETTQQDTTTSTTETAPANDAAPAATEQQTAADAEAGGEVEDGGAASDKDTSVLGGDVAEESDDEPAGPPEKYELALEGVTLDAEAVAAAEPVFRELGLNNDQANKLMPVAKDFAERTAAATLQSIVEAGAAQKKDWLDAFVADPEIGGAKREETEHLAAKGLDALGFGKDHPFRKALTETGFGNHPDMIRAFRKIGEIAGEDGFVRADSNTTEQLDLADRMYGAGKTKGA